MAQSKIIAQMQTTNSEKLIEERFIFRLIFRQTSQKFDNRAVCC